MPTQQIAKRRAPIVDAGSPSDDGELRELAVNQLERRRRFRMHAISYAAVCVVLIVIWATTEYHNAAGWPTSGFSQSSSIPHEWNVWIIYPLMGLGLMLAVDAWKTFGRKPITDREIRREMDRLSGAVDGAAEHSEQLR